MRAQFETAKQGGNADNQFIRPWQNVSVKDFLCSIRNLIVLEGEIIMTNPKGRFGIHGGQYVPETLMNAVNELEEA